MEPIKEEQELDEIFQEIHEMAKAKDSEIVHTGVLTRGNSSICLRK